LASYKTTSISTLAVTESNNPPAERHQLSLRPRRPTPVANSRQTSIDGNPYLFTGRRLDILDNGSLTIQYSRARYYDTETGRFISRDPIGYKDGMNFYEYVKSRPVILPDPFGKQCNWCQRHVLCQWKECSFKVKYYTCMPILGVACNTITTMGCWEVGTAFYRCYFRGKVCDSKQRYARKFHGYGQFYVSGCLIGWVNFEPEDFPPFPHSHRRFPVI